MSIVYGATNLWAIQWLPFALLFAVRLLQGTRLTDGLGLAVALTLATLSDWHQPVLLLLTVIVLALSSAFTRHQGDVAWARALRRLLWALLLYALLVSPLAVIVLRELLARDALLQTPTWFHQFEILGWRGFQGNVVSYGVLYGWMSLALVMYGITRGLDFWMRCFAGLLIMFFVLSLGEGVRLPGVAKPVLPLPFLLWRQLPLLGVMRGPLYFWLMVQVCIAILAGHGAKKLWERIGVWQQGLSPLLRPLMGASLLGLLLAEVLQAPLTPVPGRIHPVYEAIQREDNGAAILDAPIGYTIEGTRRHAGWTMYLQTIHKHPLIGGYTQFDGRKRLAFLEQNRVLASFTDRWVPRDEHIAHGVEGLQSFLAQHQVSWIILRKGFRAPVCDQQRSGGWAARKLLTLIAPAVVNEEIRAVWNGPPYCGDWDSPKAQEVDTLVRQTIGPPVWDDAELVAYRVR